MSNPSKKALVIGAGFAGMSVATFLAKKGWSVTVIEKHNLPGGRARKFEAEGFTFDMGPSWYWMPDVFEKFFSDFNYKVSDFYKLKLLNPSFDVVFPLGEIMSVPEKYSDLSRMFESIEKGGAAQLDKFMEEAQYKYETGMGNLVYNPGLSLLEFADLELIKGTFRLQVFSSFRKHVRKFFSNPKLISLMEFPVLFLGAMPQDTPALYSLMNYAGLKLGTWYPEGGFAEVINAMMEVGKRNGVKFHFNSPVEQILVQGNKMNSIMVNGEKIECDAIIASADYHHVESKLLPESHRNYKESYWDKKTFAPSSLIFYI